MISKLKIKNGFNILPSLNFIIGNVENGEHDDAVEADNDDEEIDDDEKIDKTGVFSKKRNLERKNDQHHERK